MISSAMTGHRAHPGLGELTSSACVSRRRESSRRGTRVFRDSRKLPSGTGYPNLPRLPEARGTYSRKNRVPTRALTSGAYGPMPSRYRNNRRSVEETREETRRKNLKRRRKHGAQRVSETRSLASLARRPGATPSRAPCPNSKARLGDPGGEAVCPDGCTGQHPPLGSEVRQPAFSEPVDGPHATRRSPEPTAADLAEAPGRASRRPAHRACVECHASPPVGPDPRGEPGHALGGAYGRSHGGPA